MTHTAILVSLDMRSRRVVFARGKHAIVTGLAVTCDTGMVKRSRYKARGLMTVNTVVVSGYVIIRFAGSGVTVMATAAIVGYALVIKRGASKGCCVMAITAIIARGYRNVRRVYFRIRSCCISAVMARITTRRPGYVAVIKHRRCPCDASSMTEFAVVAIGWAVRRAASSDTFGGRGVVTTGASTVVCQV